MGIAEIIKALKSQDFKEGDSFIASSIMHPQKAAVRIANALKQDIATASGYSDPYDNPIPWLSPEREKQVESALNIAGLLQTGAIQFSPKSAGGTLGTMARKVSGAMPETEFSKAHAIAQKNAALPIDKGGLGLPANNTAMDRAKAMGYIDGYHGTADDINEFDLSQGGKTTNNPVGQLGISLAKYPELADEFSLLASVKKGGQAGSYQGASIYPLMHRAEKAASVRLDNGLTNHEVVGAVRDAWGNGFDGLRMDNYTTPQGLENKQFYLIKNPSQIRSRFAAFDPMKKDSSDILASALQERMIG